ncbi:MAG: PASTA domain-containing protein [Chloroflexi bacterium]|nr:PASTA domain-containing protein [Chloroflexota bacterium]
MQRVVVAVRRQAEAAETDFEVPTDVTATDLVEQLSRSLGAPAGAGALELRAVSLGRALRPEETLADAGLWDGAILVLARSTDPVDQGTRGGALAVAEAPTSLAVVQMPPPPVLAMPPLDRRKRKLWPFIVGGLAILVVLGSAIWLVTHRDSRVSPAPVPDTTATAEPTAGSAAQSPSLATGAQPTPDEDAAWRDLLGRLDLLWTGDLQSAITLLQAFHSQYPTRVEATDKLYAALVEYGKKLRSAGDLSSAADVFNQAIKLQPQRIEARTELAAMTPPATEAPAPTVPPAPAPAPPPPAAAAPAPAPAAAAAAPAPAPSQPAPAPAVCDVQSVDNACPLADGTHVDQVIGAPDGRQYYWFGVPQPGMQLHVQAGGPACPCSLLVFSDQVDNGQTPIASGDSDLEQYMTDPGPYLIEVGSAQGGEYGLDFGLVNAPPPADLAETSEASAGTEALPAPAPAAALVSIPPLVGHSPGEASDRLRAAGLNARVQPADRYSAAGAGTVAAQDPPAGAAVAQGSTVTVLVATGNVVVPNVAGLTEGPATAVLHDAGLNVEVRHAARTNVAGGQAAETNPPAGAALPAGTTVILTIALG